MYHLLLQWELVRVIDEYLALCLGLLGHCHRVGLLRAWRCVGNMADG